MSDRTLTVTITLPEDADENLGGLSITTESQGIPSEMVPTLLLAAAETMVRLETTGHLVEQNPMATGDVIEVMAFLNARMSVLDAIIHLPQVTNPVGVSLDLSPE